MERRDIESSYSSIRFISALQSYAGPRGEHRFLLNYLTLY